MNNDNTPNVDPELGPGMTDADWAAAGIIVLDDPNAGGGGAGSENMPRFE